MHSVNRPERCRVMGIRQLPSGAFQVRFQHHGVAFASTYPTREDAEDAEPLLRAAALGHRNPASMARHSGPSQGSPQLIGTVRNRDVARTC
jgi:hypothetical protein